MRVSVIHRSIIGVLAAAAWLQAGPVRAQTAAFSDVPDRFRLEAGGFRIGADTNLTFNNGSGTVTPVNFESLNVPDSGTRFYVEGFWRPWRRHEFSLSWYDNNREGDPRTVQRQFTWGDRVVTAGTSVTARASSSYLSGVYRFAAYKNDRFEIGPALGVGYLSLEAAIRGDASLSASAGTVSGPFDIAKSVGQPTGDLGGYLYWWPARRLLVRGDFRYIIVKPEDSEASIVDTRASAVYHLSRNFGVGLQYVYNKFRHDREVLSRELGGSLRYSGGQVVVSAAF